MRNVAVYVSLFAFLAVVVLFGLVVAADAGGFL